MLEEMVNVRLIFRLQDQLLEVVGLSHLKVAAGEETYIFSDTPAIKK